MEVQRLCTKCPGGRSTQVSIGESGGVTVTAAALPGDLWEGRWPLERETEQSNGKSSSPN